MLINIFYFFIWAIVLADEIDPITDLDATFVALGLLIVSEIMDYEVGLQYLKWALYKYFRHDGPMSCIYF